MLDRVRSGQSHEYRRYLQFGQGLKLDAQPDRLELVRKGKPVADVFSETTAPAQQRRYAKGDERDPMAGLIFPDFRDVDQRWTAWFDTRGDDVDHAFTISLKAGEHAFHAALGSSLDTNPVRVDVDRGGKPRFSLFVTRDGGKLAVKQVDAHGKSG